uniref:Uncharacterized protein n=1 Tax=Chromera velia CCMP2878 TaxID=1169474 RepID=A0A0G4G165_9ALVE|eukprot:Cvel_19649.t1-p1 / transcript=Cvel_19649.t1 / gene=Cvel_19649 / organism=Chromera_velia_CCMP2878 / gene_product=hypothetical protein / transcript_product=hypothetical protein / location=Cvel_scaffold1712:25638-26919(-) / protein_length=198 / sequence_SO=supercontig / SO=protein_coding / is_pseudo=false
MILDDPYEPVRPVTYAPNFQSRDGEGTFRAQVTSLATQEAFTLRPVGSSLLLRNRLNLRPQAESSSSHAEGERRRRLEVARARLPFLLDTEALMQPRERRAEGDGEVEAIEAEEANAEPLSPPPFGGESPTLEMILLGEQQQEVAEDEQVGRARRPQRPPPLPLAALRRVPAPAFRCGSETPSTVDTVGGFGLSGSEE